MVSRLRQKGRPWSDYFFTLFLCHFLPIELTILADLVMCLCACRITEKPSQLALGLCEKGLQVYVQWCESTNSDGTDGFR